MAIATTIIILSSTSTVGVILSIVVWLASFWGRNNRLRTRYMMAGAAIGIIVLFMNLDLFNATLSKFILAAEGGSTFGSRITGSFEIIGAQSWIEKIIGTNYNDTSGFIATHGVHFAPRSVVQIYYQGGAGHVFLNTFGQLIFKYGVVGFLLFVWPLINRLKDKNYTAKQYVIMILVAIFGQTMLLNTTYFMIVIMVILFDKITPYDAQRIGV